VLVLVLVLDDLRDRFAYENEYEYEYENRSSGLTLGGPCRGARRFHGPKPALRGWR
jgi:hypothetical protein